MTKSWCFLHRAGFPSFLIFAHENSNLEQIVANNNEIQETPEELARKHALLVQRQLKRIADSQSNANVWRFVVIVLISIVVFGGGT